MNTERNIYIGCIVGAVLFGAFGVYWLASTFNAGWPWWLAASLVLGIIGNAMAGYMAWRALNGMRFAPSSPFSITLKFLGAAIVLTLFGPRIWAALTR